MKLSEAIRKGAKLRPQSIIKAFDYNWFANIETVKLSSCALGAAYEAVFKLDINEDSDIDEINANFADDLRREFPELAYHVFHPVDKEKANLGDIISDLNDSHDWTREKIADWVEAQGF